MDVSDMVLMWNLAMLLVVYVAVLHKYTMIDGGEGRKKRVALEHVVGW